ncbi:MAG: hypothetical protein KatS3mg076_2236 [Candidatus Binatia bacterium]|nr:MAG: hypothetical protein KatS3mg076_2236 [Candidatus Binatia bacterium]
MLPTEDMARGDREARLVAQTVFDRPLVLEAGAGTGKTTVLVTRILGWSLGPGWERAEKEMGPGPERVARRVFERVVAITFTESAAEELAERTAEFLRTVAQGELPPGLLAEALPACGEVARSRARALLSALDRIVLRTIHSFCARILASFPLEAGVHPAFEIDADGKREAALVRRVLERAVEGELRPLLLELARLGHGLGAVEAALLELRSRGVSSVDLEESPFVAERVGPVWEKLREAFFALGSCAERSGDGAASKLARRARRIAAVLPRHLPRDAESFRSAVQWLRGRWPVEEKPKGGRSRFAEAEKTQGEEFSLARRRLSEELERICGIDAEKLELARAALLPLLREVEGELRRQGVETFDTLLERTASLLRGSPEVARKLRRSFDQLLVDEFQDTDVLQCEILRYLSLAEPGPVLFLVGDPKQSIYGWRDADLRAYDDFVRSVEKNGGLRLELVENFRSVPPILDEVSRALAPLFERRHGIQPPFQDLVPCAARAPDSGFRAGEHGPVEYWECRPWDDAGQGLREVSAAELRRLEARAVALDLLDLHREHGVRWREMALLFRATTDLDVYLHALRELGIPYLVRRDRQFYRRREVIEAAALVRCVLDPADELALLAFLRSSLVGVPDAAWIPLWARNFPSLVASLSGPRAEVLVRLDAVVGEVSSLLAGLPELRAAGDWSSRLRDALRRIAALREAFSRDPGDGFVERLRELFLADPLVAARKLGPYRLANALRFFDGLAATLDRGESVPGFLRGLRTDVRARREAREAAPPVEEEDAVVVSTIHQAKGLGFEHVYLLDLARDPRGSGEGETRAGRSRGRFEYRLFGVPSPGWRDVEDHARELREAEQVRTLYVAMTRAKRRLVLSGRWGDGEGKGSRGKRSHGALLLSRHAESVSVLAERALARGTHVVEHDGVLWVFPSLRKETAGLAVPATGSGLPGAEAVEAASLALEHRRRAARERANRPYAAGVASDEAEAFRTLFSPGETSEEMPRASDAEAVALAAGTVVHRILEALDAERDLRVQIGELLEGPGPGLEQLVPPRLREDVRRRARELFDRFLSGPLAARWKSMAPRILGREVPILLEAEGTDGPTRYYSGVIDLLYRDEKGEVVVADYKTDEISEDEVEGRVGIYRLQLERYARAVRKAWDLPRLPRCELWFLHPGVVREV